MYIYMYWNNIHYMCNVYVYINIIYIWLYDIQYKYGFKGNERTEVHQHGGVDVKKGIRLEVINIQGRTYDIHFNDTMADVQDDFVVIDGSEAVMICLHFEGENCLPWSKYECKAHGDTIAHALRIPHIDDSLAAKIRRAALAKKLKRKR